MNDTVVVKRNNVDMLLGQVRGKRGDWKDRLYFAPDLDIYKTPEKFQEFVQWFGLDTIVNKMSQFMSLTCQAAMDEATSMPDPSGMKDANGNILMVDKEFDESQFVKIISALSTRGESKDELEERLAELLEKLSTAGVEMESSVGDPTKMLTVQQKFIGIANELQTVRHALEAKKRNRKKNLDSQPVTA